MENITLMQFFEWYLPDNGLFWERCIAQAPFLANNGINMVWLPPAYKGASGNTSVGYDVYDTYDLGEFNQKGSIATKYGTKQQYINAVKAFQDNNIKVLADIVLNHMMGADATEEIYADINHYHNRNEDIIKHKKIKAWTKFTFPARNGKYSDFVWNHTHFSGTDWDEFSKEKAIYSFEGKNWSHDTDSENINYDYLMGADIDSDNPEVINALCEWGKWYFDTVNPDGVRLDAVKHISFHSNKNWLNAIREYTAKNFFAVAEYWSNDINKLLSYLNATEYNLSLFDVPLHFAFLRAATSSGQIDMSRLFDNTLYIEANAHCVTFVDNHDTQPGQALSSFIPEWFKPLAYALILLRANSLPCVFYGDYYGIPHDNIKPVTGIKKMIYARKHFAYGKEHLYFDDPSIVGFTREGDIHADSGIAVLLTDSIGGCKKMYLGTQHNGKIFHNIMNDSTPPVLIDNEGYGVFNVDGGSVSIWVCSEAYRRIYLNIE